MKMFTILFPDIFGLLMLNVPVRHDSHVEVDSLPAFSKSRQSGMQCKGCLWTDVHALVITVRSAC